MRIDTLSTFPGMFDSVMGASMMRRAQEKGILRFEAHDLRDWTYDRHRTTDDDPYGGGDGLVMKCEPLFEAVEAIAAEVAGGAVAQRPADPGAVALAEPAASPAPSGPVSAEGAPHVVFMAPHGQQLDEALVAELAAEESLLFVCGHYEGIDERAYSLADRIVSIGDYVLTSGELAAMVAIDAVVRKLPGVLGAPTGADNESFSDGLLEHPQYTRPAAFRGMEVPPVLLSGDHGAVARWRRAQQLERTARLRPDLLRRAWEAGLLSPADQEFLDSSPL